MCAGLIFQKWELYYGGASSTAIIWAYALFRNIHLNRLKFKQTPNLQYSLQKRDICDENINTGISSEQMLVDKITNYILSNYQKNINLNDVIDETGISRSKATKVFKEVTKSTINEYLTMVRIEHAKSLLLTKSVTVTAFDVGFNNPSYFTTVFKKYTKQSPTEYQHRAKKPNAISV
ncbi:hypothetical protein GCM10007852_12700 [Agaribacter marinus]|uniref:HTH araC/xylS-type domain-containing protein n=1 Tax=Agaribacter marinus TaxID=1431249 RepID=A0AA37SVS1_9ALTE|nr:hypothetical protein GCM10007852_12700 [Agaribacter marinus]